MVIFLRSSPSIPKQLHLGGDGQTYLSFQYLNCELEQGLEQGLKKGKATGERAVLLLQLSRRFGPLDEATRHKLESASTEELELWANNVLDAQSLEDVFTRH